MEYAALDFKWYVPEFDGNRERYEAGEDPAPMMVEIKTPSYGYIRTLADRAGKSPAQRLAIDKDYFTKHTRGVQNLTLNGEPVKSGADLWRLGAEENRIDAALFLELFRAIDDKARLREGQVLGLSGPSASG